MGTTSRRSKAIDIAAMDAIMAGMMAIVLYGLYSWATKEGSTFSQAPWTTTLAKGLTYRSIVLGGLVGGIFGSIFRPSWGPLAPAISSVCFICILEVTPDFPRIAFILAMALIYGFISFFKNISGEPAQPIEQANALATESFDKARQLGTLIHEGYRLNGSNLNDAQLLDLARVLYSKDATFQELWNDVKGHPPGDEDIPWLSLWRTL